MLTSQQEAFAQAVASGKNQADAYRSAYPKAQNWKPNSVAVNASKLMADANISLRVDAIRAELAERNLWTREDSARALIGVVKSPDKASDVVAAVKVLNDMHGFDAPKEIKHIGDAINISISFDNGGPGGN